MSVADNTGNSPSGMSVDVYTPQAWIVEQAFLAQEKMMPFTMKDVTPDMRRNVIRVVGHPSTPVNLTANGMGYASNVTHVVLRYTKKSAVIQPETETPTNQTIQSAVGSPIVMHGQVAEFSLADLAAARGPSGGGEFFVTLLGDNPIAARKDFKVKSKDFSKLIGQ